MGEFFFRLNVALNFMSRSVSYDRGDRLHSCSFSAKETGPLSTLQRALTTNLKVTVVIRTFKGVRGECTGYLVAYDKYMNLVRSTFGKILAVNFR